MTTVAVGFHVFIALFAFGTLPFPGLYFIQIAQGADVATVRRVSRIATARGKIGGPCLILAAALGFWAASSLGIPLGAHWLIAAYVLFAVLFVTGFGYFARREARIAALAESAPDGAPTGELANLLTDATAMRIGYLDLLVWAAIFYVMIFKPVW